MKIVVIGGHGLIGSSSSSSSASPATRPSPPTSAPASTRSPARASPRRSPAPTWSSTSPTRRRSRRRSWSSSPPRRAPCSPPRTAGVGHHVALSIVGADRLPDSGYLRAKVAQETLIGLRDPVLDRPRDPVLRVRRGIADSSTDGDTVRLPPPRIQPMAADDVAGAVGRVAVGAPVNGIVEIGGPEPFRFDELIRIGLAAQRPAPSCRPRRHYFGTKLQDTSLAARRRRPARRTPFQDWLSALATHRRPHSRRPRQQPTARPPASTPPPERSVPHEFAGWDLPSTSELIDGISFFSRSPWSCRRRSSRG